MNHRLLILVCSCHGYHGRTRYAADAAGCAEKRRACRDTWLRQLPDGARYAFFAGAGAPVEYDMWVLDCPDDYDHLPLKTQAAFRRALTVPGWDYLFKCDDDTYLATDRLMALVAAQQGQPTITSWHGRCTPHTAHGGAGYLMPRSMVEAVASDTLSPTGAEDREVTASVLRAGGRLVLNPDFQPGHSVTPSRRNTCITCHHLTAEMMYAVHAAYTDKTAEELRAERHAAWLSRQPRHHQPVGGVLRRPQTPAPKPAESLPPPADASYRRYFRLPNGVRRVVVCSNVAHVNLDALGLGEGDLLIHLGRAAHLAETLRLHGVLHWAVVRHGRGWRWYVPESFDGCRRVIFVDDAVCVLPYRWWALYQRNAPGKSPTTGFIIANVLRELYPTLPLVLAGFDPEHDHGTQRWSGHAWRYEAMAYRRDGFDTRPPQS